MWAVCHSTVVDSTHNADRLHRVGYRGLAVVGGLITLVTFGTERLVYETTEQTIGAIPAYVMGGVVCAVGIGGVYAGVREHGRKAAMLLSAGPVGGLFVYLIGYHLVLPPSEDAPTWLVFLGFAGGLFAIGFTTHLCGRLLTRVL